MKKTNGTFSPSLDWPRYLVRNEGGGEGGGEGVVRGVVGPD